MSTHFSVYCSNCDVEGPDVRVSGGLASLDSQSEAGEPRHEWQAWLKEHEWHDLHLLHEQTREERRHPGHLDNPKALRLGIALTRKARRLPEVAEVDNAHPGVVRQVVDQTMADTWLVLCGSLTVEDFE